MPPAERNSGDHLHEDLEATRRTGCAPLPTPHVSRPTLASAAKAEPLSQKGSRKAFAEMNW